MNVRIRSMSVLPVVLPFLLIAALTHSLSLAAIAQNQAQKESAPFKNVVEETVSKLLSVPVYTASDEKLLNEAGDRAALAITRIVSEQEMNSPETGRRILLILHLAFEAPQSIIERNNKTPKAALRLLDQLEHTDYGRQPNVIGNARFEIKHNSSTGRPLEPVTLPGEPVIDWGHTEVGRQRARLDCHYQARDDAQRPVASVYHRGRLVYADAQDLRAETMSDYQS
jgi:hypothetical protein